MKHELTSRRKERRIMAVWTSLVLTTALFTTSAFAADSDPLTIVNNLSDFIFSCIKAIGIIILGWGVVPVSYTHLDVYKRQALYRWNSSVWLSRGG